MNLILFKGDENLTSLPLTDHRAIHIMSIIKPEVGDSLDIGIVNGLKGKMIIENITVSSIEFSTIFNQTSAVLLPVTLIIGTPRPPVAKRLLKDLTTIGVGRIIMTATDLGEKTYLTSKLWKNEKYMDYIYDGCSQAESTIIPDVKRFFSLKKALDSIVNTHSNKIALDNIRPKETLSCLKLPLSESIIVIGGERGFSDRERDMLEAYGYRLFSMGERVLRTETVCHMIMGHLLTAANLI